MGDPRDDLAALIRKQVLKHDGFYCDPGFVPPDAWPMIADAIFAAGYVKPIPQRKEHTMQDLSRSDQHLALAESMLAEADRSTIETDYDQAYVTILVARAQAHMALYVALRPK